MTALLSLLVFCQALGAFIGASAAVWAELSYLRHVRGGRVDDAERAHLRSIARGLRFGMTLLLISSFALVIVAYLLRSVAQPALTESYWLLVVFAILVIYVSWALSRKRIPFMFGSAIAFTAWWLLAYLTFGSLSLLSFGATIAFFVIATAIFYAILGYARMLAKPKR